jgi:CRISPR system Cascade subunit CasE
MYISKIVPRQDASPAAIRQVVADDYQPHVVLWKIMSGGRTMNRSFTYRLESETSGPFFYVVSEQPPADDLGAWSISTRAYEPVLREEEHYSFVLRANPVRTPHNHERQRKRHDIILDARHKLREAGIPRSQWPTNMQLAQEQGFLWLQQRAESCGFSIATSGEGAPIALVESYSQQKFFKKKGTTPVTLSVLDFRGILKVTNPILFREKLFNGIGRGKAFGCGLMLIRRAR